MSAVPSPDVAAAIAHHQVGRFADAEPLYRRALANNPGDIDALRLLGVVRFQRGDSAEAEKLLGAALQAAPNYAKVHDNLGFVLSGLGRNDDALPAVSRAVDLDPGNPSFLFNLGSLLATMGRHDEAVGTLERLLAIDASHTEAHQLAAITLLKMGRAQAALEHLDACVRLGVATAGTHAHRAIAFTQLRDLDALNRLVDFSGLVKPAHITVPPGFASLAEFNQALAVHVAENTTLHEDHTTVHGLDTHEILELDKPAVVGLKQFIYSQIEKRDYAIFQKQATPLPSARRGNGAPHRGA